MNNRKNMDELRAWQDMKAPEALKQRTLEAAREARRAEQADAPQRTAPAPRRFGMAKRILAAACAFGVIVGGTAVWRAQATGQSAGDAVAEAVAHSFGIVAYAADTGEEIAPKDSRIVFDIGSEIGSLGMMRDTGFFSGQLFKVTGENIQTVSASIDKAGLYRMRSFAIGEEEVNAFFDGTDPRAKGSDDVTAGSPDGKQMYAEVLWKLGSSFTEAYDPNTIYGLFGTPKPITKSHDVQAEWHSWIDEFDGATLTVTVTFTDGTTDTQTMTLHTGKLGCEYVDGEIGPQLTGEVLTDAEADAQGYVYGVYAELTE